MNIKLLFSLTILFFLASCSDLSSSSSSTTTSPSAPSTPSKPPGVVEDKVGFMPGLIRQSQVLPAFSKCLGLTLEELSSETKERYISLKSNLSEEGKVKDLTGPLLMAMTQIAGDVCDDLIRKESQMQTPVYLSGFDLSVETAPGPVQFQNSIKKITSSCWSRKASDTEITFIISNYNSTSLSNNSGKKGALFLCTALMSSPDVMLY